MANSNETEIRDFLAEDVLVSLKAVSMAIGWVDKPNSVLINIEKEIDGLSHRAKDILTNTPVRSSVSVSAPKPQPQPAPIDLEVSVGGPEPQEDPVEEQGLRPPWLDDSEETVPELDTAPVATAPLQDQAESEPGNDIDKLLEAAGSNRASAETDST